MNDHGEILGGARRAAWYEEAGGPASAPQPTVAGTGLPGPESGAVPRPGAGPAPVMERAGPWITAPAGPPAPASWGWRGRVNRGSGGLLKLDPREDELAHRAAVATVQQATWTRSVNVIVANPKGGSGKTPAAVILAGILARIRGGGVCAWEASEAFGTLRLRAEGDPQRGLAELLQHARQISSSGTLESYVARQTSHAHVIGSIGPRAGLTRPDVTAVRRVLDTYYSITVADTGNNLGHEAHRAAMRTADAVLVPCLISIDAWNGVQTVLREMSHMGAHVGGRGGLVSRVVIVLGHDGGPEDPQVDSAVRERLEHLGVPVVEVPFDKAIRRGGPISLDALGAESQRAWTRVAAALVQALNNAPLSSNLVAAETVGTRSVPLPPESAGGARPVSPPDGPSTPPGENRSAS